MRSLGYRVRLNPRGSRASDREPHRRWNEQERATHEPDRFAGDGPYPSDWIEPESTRAKNDERCVVLGGVLRDGRGRVCSRDSGVSEFDSGPPSTSIVKLGDFLLECPNTIGTRRH